MHIESNKEAKAQRGQGICPKSHSKEADRDSAVWHLHCAAPREDMLSFPHVYARRLRLEVTSQE